MTRNTSREVDECRGCEVRRIESLDDVVREIADRRLTREFGDSIPPERAAVLTELPDKLEPAEAFNAAAKNAGIRNVEGVLGWSTKLEDPAHVLKRDVPTEVATLVHENLHRLTAPETLRELTASPVLKNLYEGITEYLSEHAVSDLHEHRAGECYPDQVREAKRLADAIGETDLRDYFFKNHCREEVLRAIELLKSGESKLEPPLG